ncbi:GNAT family N-acetyltransferase [Paenibacillus sp. TRM 82003]|nr:GNAT family N-acetyltransferase [Paenibacillus sp. TRM 82003]
MVKIFELKDKIELTDELVSYIWSKWGTPQNYNFYKDCMIHSLEQQDKVPKFYFAFHDDRVVGCYALLRNELVARQDLFPWFACLFVEPDFRGKGIGARLLEHATSVIRENGYNRFYLSTSLDNYYEKYGWTYLADSYYFNGDETKIYLKTT